MAAEQKKQRRLIVHLGVQKTGSTGLQRHLRMNSDALAGRLVPLTPEKGSPMRPLGRAAVAYSLSPTEQTARALEEALQEVLSELPRNDLPVLLSHENLAGAMPGNSGETALYPALPQIAWMVMRTARDFDVEFVIYTRDMATWRPSVWAQAVRTDGYTGTLPEFLQATAALPAWDDLTDRIGRVIGAQNITCFRLEDEPRDGHPGRLLLRHAGLSDGDIDALTPLDGTANPRLNAGATEFLRRLNQSALNPHARGKVVDLVARAQHLFTADAPSEGTL